MCRDHERCQGKTTESFPIVIPGRSVVAGHAAKEFVAQSGKQGKLAIVMLLTYRHAQPVKVAGLQQTEGRGRS